MSINNKKINAIFIGTSDFGILALEALIKKYNIRAVITQEDKKIGRKQVLTSPPIKQIAKKYGINQLLATEPEIKAGRYTGGVSGIPCFQAGKIDKLLPWLQKNGESLTGSTFYSDSHNDLPLLGLVDNPVAVNADKILTKIAQKKGWDILNWR